MRKGVAYGARLQPGLVVTGLAITAFLLIAVCGPYVNNASGGAIWRARKTRRLLTATWLAHLALAMPAAPHPHDAAWAQRMQDLAVSLAQIGVKSPVSLQRQHRRRQQHRAQAFDPELKRRQPRCAVYSGVRFHADVAAGLLWAFQVSGCGLTCTLAIPSFVPVNPEQPPTTNPVAAGGRLHSDSIHAPRGLAQCEGGAPRRILRFSRTAELSRTACRYSALAMVYTAAYLQDKMICGCRLPFSPWFPAAECGPALVQGRTAHAHRHARRGRPGAL